MINSLKSTKSCVSKEESNKMKKCGKYTTIVNVRENPQNKKIYFERYQHLSQIYSDCLKDMILLMNRYQANIKGEQIIVKEAEEPTETSPGKQLHFKPTVSSLNKTRLKYTRVT